MLDGKVRGFGDGFAVRGGRSVCGDPLHDGRLGSVGFEPRPVPDPIDGAKVSGVVRIRATASDVGSGVARVEFYVDGKLLGAVTAAPYWVNRNTSNKQQVARGSHAIYAVEIDVVGNRRTSTTITVTVV